MSLLTSVNETSKGVSSFLKKVPNIPGQIYGLQTNSTWVAGPAGSSSLQTSIAVPGLTASNIIQVGTSPTLVGSQNIQDAAACWVIAATAGTNQILVYVSASGGGTNGAPVDNAHYGLAWSVVG